MSWIWDATKLKARWAMHRAKERALDAIPVYGSIRKYRREKAFWTKAVARDKARRAAKKK